MKRILAVFCLTIAALPLVHAQTTLVVSPGLNLSSDAQNFSGTLGELFTVNPGYTVTVTGIGFWDYGTAGVDAPDTVSVAIFNNLGTVVTGTQISTSNSGASGAPFSASGDMGSTYTPTGANSGSGQFFVYTLTTPVVLSSGDYAIAGWGYNNVANYEINGGGGNSIANFNTISGALTLDGSSYNDLAATMPTIGNETSGASIMAATFTATAIPEPSTYAAIFGGLALAVAAVRSAKRRHLAA